MNFLEPLGLIGLAALLPIIALYFLKLKREQRVVPSTLLWRKVIEDLQVNAPFQRLKYSLLLLMQLVLAALLGFALARPYLSMPGYEGKRIVLLIDTSASMGTTDAGKSGSQTRLAAAIEDAKRRIEELQFSDEMALIAFDRDVRQLSKFTNDRAELSRLVAALEPRDVETRAEPAFQTALELIAGKPNAEVLVLSDGCFGDVKLLDDSARAVSGNLEDRAATGADAHKADEQRLRLNNFRFVSYGQAASDNAGITQIDARAHPVKLTDDNGQRVDSTETEIFVMVENFAPKPRDVLLGLSTETQAFSPKLITLQGRPEREESLTGTATANTSDAARSVEVFKLPAGTTGVVTARILSPKDKLAVDDSASVVVGGSEEIKLLLVTSGNYFLSKACAALRGAKVTTQTPAEFLKDWEQKGKQTTEGYDVCVFEGLAPLTWTEGGALFLGAMPPLPGFVKDEKDLEWPEVVDWDSAHPVMRYVNFGNVTVAKTQKWKVPKTAKVLVEGGGAPLAVAFENDRLRAVGVAFDIFASDWAYRPSLPLFLRNAIPWLAQASPRRQPACLQTGATLSLPAGLSGSPATLLTPDGRKERVELSLEHATQVKGTEKTGLYKLQDLPGDAARTYAFNLASRNESDNAARGALKVGDVTMTSTPAAVEGKREIWRYLALAALGLLLLEWWVFHRRVGL